MKLRLSRIVALFIIVAVAGGFITFYVAAGAEPAMRSVRYLILLGYGVLTVVFGLLLRRYWARAEPLLALSAAYAAALFVMLEAVGL